MNLHENKTLFRQAVQFTADQLKIDAVYIEKDYWVTYVLHAIFSNEIGKETIFKGGTALSKGKLIDRFSEDVDLVVLRNEGESDSRMKTKLKKISTLVGSILPEVEIEGVTNKLGMIRKTAHTYSKEIAGDLGQIRDVIVLESTWLGNYDPFANQSLNSLVGEMMADNGQVATAEEYGMIPFEARVLDTTRTFCEKIMSLVRFSYTEDSLEDLKKKIRHTYDLHKLLHDEKILEFFNSPAFEVMILQVANDDVASFRNNNKWLVHHPSEARIFKDLDSIWEELKPVYNSGFAKLVYGALPRDEEILQSLNLIRERLKPIAWTIELAVN
ncbi:MAG: nucleotidyl transferase AbiEii/AbiGii toxin family protein [Pyrinomonadaceae bacterium]